MGSRFWLLVAVSALAVVLGFRTFTPASALLIIRYGAYWLMLVAFVAFVVTLVRSLRGGWTELRSWRTWWKPLAVVVAATVLLHVNERHEQKIVADEVVMQLTARDLHFSREAGVTVRGYEYAGMFKPLIKYIDKRPVLFPFLLATVHDLTGFRPGNVYPLNIALSAVFMLLVFLVGRKVGGDGGGVAAVLLIASIPLVAQSSCSAGFEILNLLMIVLTIWLGMRASERPENDDRLGAFVLSGVLLAQARYESALFVLPVVGTVVYLWWRQRAVRVPWPLFIAPLLIVICPLQLNVFRVSQGAWQLTDIAGADAPFAWRYFYDNCGHALNFFLSLDGTQPNSVLVGVAGALGVGFFVLRLYREHHAIFAVRPVEATLCIFLLGLILHTLVMLCYFWGHWDDLLIHRLSLPAHLLLVYALVFTWPKLVSWSRHWELLSAITLAYIVAFTLPHTAAHEYTHQNLAARATNWLAGHIRGLGDRSALAIDQNAGLQWFLYGKSSVTSDAIAARPEGFLTHFRNRSFAEFFLVERAVPVLRDGTRLINIADDFEGALELELIEERAFAPLYLVRLNRIVSIDETKLMAWAKSRRERPAGPAVGVRRLSPRDQKALAEWLRQLP